MNTKDTPEKAARKQIDQQLQTGGWDLLGKYIGYKDLDQQTATGYIEELKTDTGPVDYGLLINGELAALIEAKPNDMNPAGHFQQAERYVKSVDGPYAISEDYGVPVAFVSNGLGSHIYDFRDLSPSSRPVSGIYTPNGLTRLVTRDYREAHKQLQEFSVSQFDPDLWEHQKECVNAIEGSLRNRERRMLIKMATGSGKTRVAQALTYRLLNSGLVDRVLFIPDTRKLASDAYDSFSGYDPTGIDESFGNQYRVVNLEEDEASRLKRSEVVVTTLQKMYYLLNNDEIKFHPGDFDLIITDECHRSVYESDGYGGVFQKFDAIEVGLTATPTQRTLSRFDNNLIYEYNYESAVMDEHVVPFQPYVLDTRITMSGVQDMETGEYYSPDNLGSEVLVPDTHRKVGQEIRENMEDSNELTLIFARNDDHATQIVRDFRETVFSDKPDSFVQKITYKSDRPNDILTRFSDPYDPSPSIAVTVQMVSTGVDIRPLKNVVLLNPVKSPVQFNQMLGRGTRAYDDKTHFNIYDCVGALNYFEGTPPFGTLSFGTDSNDNSSAEKIDDSSTKSSPTIVDVPDEVLRSEPVFPTETGEQLTAEGFRDIFAHDVRSKSEILRQKISEATDMTSANDAVKPVLSEMSQYYIEVFLQKAYEPISGDESYHLVDYVNEVLTNRLPSFDQRKAYARSCIEEEYSLTNIEKEYLELISAVSKPPNGISQGDFFDPPLSEIGGWKRASDQFSTLSPEELVSEFRDNLSGVIGDINIDESIAGDSDGVVASDENGSSS